MARAKSNSGNSKSTRHRGNRRGTRAASKNIRATIDAEAPEIDFSTKMQDAMRTYGTYTVEHRAIPDIHDGLKPVHRRVLWAAYKMGFKASGATYKTARLVGETMGKFHPHGDAAITDTISNMIEGTPCPLLHGQGNFGSHTNMAPAAAPRYTECKLNVTSEKYLLDPYYIKVIPMVATYDGSEKEPAYLPALLPFVLATGAQGIAVGVSTQLPAYSLNTLRDVCLAMLKGEKSTVKLSKMLKFASPYGGHVYSDAKAQHYTFTNTASSISWSCDYNINGAQMTITGIHPEWNFDNRWAKIKDMEEVASADDLSKEGIKLVVTLRKKDADDDAIWQKLENMMTGDISYRCNIIMRKVDETQEFPEVESTFAAMSPFEILQDWLKWRLRLEQLALREEMKELRANLLRERLLLLACQSLDVIFSLLKRRNIDKVAELAKKLKITQEDAKFIWGIAVGRLDRLSETEQKKRIKDLQVRAKQIKSDFANPKRPVLAQLSKMEL